MRLAALDAAAEKRLLAIARQAILFAVQRKQRYQISSLALPAELNRQQGCFVTLTAAGKLRGCLGTLQGEGALAENVAYYARAAALEDPRFAPVEVRELAQLSIEISLLYPPEPLEVASKEELLRRLRPGQDGLWLEEPPRRATFLPQVWNSLPTPELFVRQLLLKGGWPADHWSPQMRCSRYDVQSFGEQSVDDQNTGHPPTEA